MRTNDDSIAEIAQALGDLDMRLETIEAKIVTHNLELGVMFTSMKELQNQIELLHQTLGVNT